MNFGLDLDFRLTIIQEMENRYPTRLESTESSEKGLDLKEVDFFLTWDFDFTWDFHLTLDFDFRL